MELSGRHELDEGGTLLDDGSGLLDDGIGLLEGCGLALEGCGLALEGCGLALEGVGLLEEGTGLLLEELLGGTGTFRPPNSTPPTVELPRIIVRFLGRPPRLPGLIESADGAGLGR